MRSDEGWLYPWKYLCHRRTGTAVEGHWSTLAKAGATRMVVGMARQLERERVLLSVSGHMILTATKPIGAPLRILNELPKKFHD